MKHWKIILAVLALTAISGLVGARIAVKLERRHAARRAAVPPEAWHEGALRSLDSKLHFTPAQKESTRQSMTAAVERLSGIRRQALAETTEVMKELINEVEASLTPEQRVEFQRMKPKGDQITLDLLRAEPSKK